MASDRSRPSDDERDHYAGVISQQGRVIVDSDWNAAQALIAAERAHANLHEIGQAGTPDDGFRISAAVPGAPNPPLWSPPWQGSPPASPMQDFLIQAGTLYLGGQRAVFPPRSAGAPVSYSYFDQPDWIAPPVDATAANFELVYLHAYEQEVSAVEDPDLYDVALGGPDTTQRLRLMRRVRRVSAGDLDGRAAWGAFLSQLPAQQGLEFVRHSARLESPLRLQVALGPAAIGNPVSDPASAPGVLGSENQLIRVQVAAPDPGIAGSPAPTLLWGYDNASFLYRAQVYGTQAAARLELLDQPPDQVHIPDTYQAVEILLTATILGESVDTLDPAQPAVLRCIAEASGVVRSLVQPLGAIDTGNPTANLLQLSEPLPDPYFNSPYPLFVRVWQSQLSFVPGQPVALTSDNGASDTGITVTLSAPAGVATAPGTFWSFALRPGTPQGLYPQRYLTAAQPPEGPRQWAAPLALIDWNRGDQPYVTELRRRFCSLTELTERIEGDEDRYRIFVPAYEVTTHRTLQRIIDEAQRGKQQLTVCLGPGRYALPAPLVLGKQHANLHLEANDGTVTLYAMPQAAAEVFAHGLIQLRRAEGLVLRGLTLEASPAALPAKVREAHAEALKHLPKAFEHLTGVPGHHAVKAAEQLRARSAALQALIAVHAVDSPGLQVLDCRFEFALPSAKTVKHFHAFGAALMTSGNCIGLKVQGCSFQSSQAASITARAPFRGYPTHVDGDQTVVNVLEQLLHTAEHALGMETPERARETPVDGEITLRQEREDAFHPFLALFGCLAVPHVPSLWQTGPEGSAFRVPVLLDQAEFSNNRFTGLTAAVSCISEAGTLDLHGNQVAQGLLGIHVIASDRRTLGNVEAVVPEQDDAPGGPDYLVHAGLIAYDELLIGLSVAMMYPGASRAEEFAEARRATRKPSIAVTGNRLDTLGSHGLMLLTDPWRGERCLEASLMVNNNQLMSRSPTRHPTALVGYGGRCSVSGNLIHASPVSDKGTRDGQRPGICLLIYAHGLDDNIDAASPDDTASLVVSGNVLEGEHNLRTLLRPSSGDLPVALRNWEIFNAFVPGLKG